MSKWIALVLLFGCGLETPEERKESLTREQQCISRWIVQCRSICFGQSMHFADVLAPPQGLCDSCRTKIAYLCGDGAP